MPKKSTKKDQANILNENSKKAQLSKKGLTIDFDPEDIEKHLPHLAHELRNPSENSIFSLNQYSNTFDNKNNNETNEEIEEEIEEEISPSEHHHLNNKLKISSKKRIENIKNNIKSRYDENSELFLPKTEDFLRRCSTIEEAMEIIDFQLKKGEITEQKAEELREICRKNGLKYFGSKKEWGYYERNYRGK